MFALRLVHINYVHFAQPRPAFTTTKSHVYFFDNPLLSMQYIYIHIPCLYISTRARSKLFDESSLNWIIPIRRTLILPIRTNIRIITIHSINYIHFNVYSQTELKIYLNHPPPLSLYFLLILPRVFLHAISLPATTFTLMITIIPDLPRKQLTARTSSHLHPPFPQTNEPQISDTASRTRDPTQT